MTPEGVAGWSALPEAAATTFLVVRGARPVTGDLVVSSWNA